MSKADHHIDQLGAYFKKGFERHQDKESMPSDAFDSLMKNISTRTHSHGGTSSIKSGITLTSKTGLLLTASVVLITGLSLFFFFSNSEKNQKKPENIPNKEEQPLQEDSTQTFDDKLKTTPEYIEYKPQNSISTSQESTPELRSIPVIENTSEDSLDISPSSEIHDDMTPLQPKAENKTKDELKDILKERNLFNEQE